MIKAAIIEALKQVTNAERLEIASSALRMAREDWKSLTSEEKQQQLALSAQLAILDYLQDEELTAFTALDGEDIYAYTDEDFGKLDAHAKK